MGKGIDSVSGENLLSEVFASVQDGISILDTDLTIIRVNTAMEKWYADRAPIVGRKCYEVYHDKGAPCFPCPTIRCLETGETECEIVPGPAGSPIEWLELYSHPMKDPETGEIKGITEFVRDITPRMKALDEQRIVGDQAQATFDSMSDAVFLLDTEARIVRCNRAAQAFTGRSADQIIGLKCHEVVHGESGHIPECPFEKMMKGGKPEILLMSINGKWFDSRIDPIRDSEGEIEGAVHVFRDITDIKTLEKRQMFTAKLFSQLPLSGNRRQIIRHILRDIQEHSGIEAVGLRLSDGEDFPYYETIGFGTDFVEKEGLLCERSLSGEIVTDEGGVPVLECICGRVLRGTVNPRWDSITDNGSFWTNSLSRYLETASESERELVTRGGCSGEGFESVALIPLRSGREIMGLLQLNDHRKDFFSRDTVDFFENISSALGVALARSMDAERWRSLTEYSPDFIMLLDRKGRIHFINRTVPDLSADQVIGRHVYDFTPPNSKEAIESVLDAVIETGVPGAYETEYVTEEGETRYFDARVGPVWDAGQIVALVCTSTDVTARKKMELALQQSEERLQLALSATAGALWDCPDVADGSEWWSPEYYRVLGYEEGEIEPGRETFMSLMHPDDKERMIGEIQASIENEDISDFEYRLKHRSGEYRWFHSRARIIRDTEGNAVRVIGTNSDINDRKLAELALKESEENYRSIFNSVYSAIFVHDPVTAEILDVNQRACQMLGKTRDEILKMSVGEFSMGIEEYNQEEVLRVNALAASGESQVIEWGMKGPNGEQRWADVYLQKATIAGEPRVLAIVRDITELKQAAEERMKLEEQIQHSQKLESLGILAGGIAHDFNNILVGILGNADLALMDIAPEHPAWGSVKDIENASRRASELVRQMLAYSGRGRFHVELTDLNRIIEEMTHMLGISISKKAQLRFDLDDNLPGVECDITQIRQVLMNLVINASEALEKGSGLITVRTSALNCERDYLRDSYLDENLESGIYCCIEVSDTGSGIPSEIRSQLFDPFFTTKLTGRGLGLAAVLGIVRGHSGAIRVNSESGKGTTFKILLPASEIAGEDTEVTREVREPSPVWETSGFVLLVDDEESVLQVGRKMLEKLGFTVLTAADGLEAIDIYREHGDEIVCVVMDLTMPRLDGAETLDELLGIDRSAQVILCSGYSEQDVSHRFVGRGFVGFIQKPYSSEELSTVLRKVLES